MTFCKAYGLAAKSMLNKEIDYDTDAINVMLCAVGYVPNQDTHQYKSSVTNEITGTGYTAGGLALASKTVVYDATTNTLVLSAANPVWTTATFTGARIAVFYDAMPGTDATRPLLAYMDFEADWSPAAENFTIALPVDGLMHVVVA